MASPYFRVLRNALKIVLVGDGGVGKTWLVSRANEIYATVEVDADYYSLVRKPFDPELVYSPTVLETCFTNVDTTELGTYTTNIWDTGGCAVFDFVRPLAYIRADVFMLCFDLSNRESFLNVTKRWLPEIQEYEPDTPVLIVGTKADVRDEKDVSSGKCYDQVSHYEAQKLAQKLGVLYREVSAQAGGDLVADAFESAVELVLNKRKHQDKKSQKWTNKTNFNPTWIPPKKFPSEIRIEPSTYVRDLRKVLDDTENADILFKFKDGSQSLYAHRIILWSTPSIFKDVLREANQGNFQKFKDLFEIIEISDVGNETAKCCNSAITCILLNNWISYEIFSKVLQFLYTGEGITKDMEHKKMIELLTAAEILKIQSLAEVCNYFLKLENLKKDAEREGETLDSLDNKLILCHPHPCIIIDELFLDLQATTLFSDVTFLVEEDIQVHAHKAILMARSPYFNALLNGNFKDVKNSQVHLNGIDCQSFLAVLEYLYTDNCLSLEGIPVKELCVIADQLCLSRLVQICEVHLQRELLKVSTHKSSHFANEFMNVFAFSKEFNAKQLTEWCLHFFAFNIESFQEIGNELDSLVKKTEEFIAEHRWPPQEYVQALEEYKRCTSRKRPWRRLVSFLSHKRRY